MFEKTRLGCAALLLVVPAAVYAIPLWPAQPGSQWIYQVTLNDNSQTIESLNFISLVERNTVQYVVADDGFAINSTDSAIFGFDNIFTDPDEDMFSLVVDSATVIETVTTGLGTFDAFLFQTIEPDYRVDNYVVPGFGLYYIEEGPVTNGEFLIAERVELIQIQAIPAPAALYLFASALICLGYGFKRGSISTSGLPQASTPG